MAVGCIRLEKTPLPDPPPLRQVHWFRGGMKTNSHPATSTFPWSKRLATLQRQLKDQKEIGSFLMDRVQVRSSQDSSCRSATSFALLLLQRLEDDILNEISAFSGVPIHLSCSCCSNSPTLIFSHQGKEISVESDKAEAEEPIVTPATSSTFSCLSAVRYSDCTSGSSGNYSWCNALVGSGFVSLACTETGLSYGDTSRSLSWQEIKKFAVSMECKTEDQEYAQVVKMRSGGRCVCVRFDGVTKFGTISTAMHMRSGPWKIRAGDIVLVEKLPKYKDNVVFKYTANQACGLKPYDAPESSAKFLTRFVLDFVLDVVLDKGSTRDHTSIEFTMGDADASKLSQFMLEKQQSSDSNLCE